MRIEKLIYILKLQEMYFKDIVPLYKIILIMFYHKKKSKY